MAICAQTVYVHCAALIDCAEVQNNALIFADRRLFPVAPVPQILVGTEYASHTGQLAFGRKGDEYLALPFIRLFFAGGCEGIVPQTVEVYKRFAPHLRTGIFREHIVLVELFAPLSKHGRTSN